LGRHDATFAYSVDAIIKKWNHRYTSERGKEMADINRTLKRSQNSYPIVNSPFQQPLVSVIIPTFNRQDSIKEALESVLAQTFQDFEAIVINDGGADVSEVINTCNHDERIVYLQHKENKGLAAARNTAIKAARGKYIAYLDDDDIYYPEHLEILVGFLESSDYKVAYTDSYQADQTRIADRYVTTRKEIIYSYDFNKEKFLIHNYIPVLNLVYRRDLLEDVGSFDETLSTHEDWELLIRLSRKYDFFHIKAVTAEFRMRDDATNMTEIKRSDFLRTLRRIYQRYSHLALDAGILEAQKNIEEFLEIDLTIRQLPSKELFRKVEQYIQQKDVRIGNLDTVIRDKDAHIGNLETAIRDKDAHIGNLESVIRDKDSQIGNLDTYAENVEAENAHLITEKIKLEAENAQSLLYIQELKREVQEKDTRIIALEKSLSWRITAPLRLLYSLIKNIPNHCCLRNPEIKTIGMSVPFKNRFLNYLFLIRVALQEFRTRGLKGLVSALYRYFNKRFRHRSYGAPSAQNYTVGLATIVILSKDRMDLIKPCLESIERHSSAEYQVEILIGDTGSTDPVVLRFYREAQARFGNLTLVFQGEYHYSRNYNRLIREHARGQHLVLLNNDTIVQEGWLDALLEPLTEQGVGVVGAKLLYPDGSLQHAGIEFTSEGLGIHTFKGASADIPEANIPALVSAVTFACAAMRHEIFDRFRLDEHFQEESQDTDFCLRLTFAGFQVLYNPHAVVIHRECSSRDWHRGEGDRRRLQRLWGSRFKVLAGNSQRQYYNLQAYRDALVVMRDDGIGDLLSGVPVFAQLRRKFPVRRLILATYARNIEMMAGFRIFDDFIPIPNGQKYAPLPLTRGVEVINLINMEMHFTPTWGTPLEDNMIPRQLVYARRLGIDPTFEPMSLPHYPEAGCRVRDLLRNIGVSLEQHFVVLNLFASNPARSWWEPFYPSLIQAVEDLGFTPLVVGVQSSRNFKGKRLVNLTGKTTTIPEFIEAVRLGSYVVSTDTSAYHIAALADIPFLAIFTGGVKPEARLAFYRRWEAVEPPPTLTCHPCWDEGCKDPYVRWQRDPCRTAVTPEMVISKLRKLVSTYPIGGGSQGQTTEPMVNDTLRV
jgi:GT2 family glycosyltransferase/ADP-heptose:LPS heptosyltransferase